VEDALHNVEGIISAKVDLEKAEAFIETDVHIDFDILKNAVANSGNYSIHKPDEEVFKAVKKPAPIISGRAVYYCPMHCEGDKVYETQSGCPICGMDLVPMATNESTEDDTYKKLLNKFWIACAFTAPVFVISMSEMIPNNPIYNWMDIYYWNWIQFLLSLPVVFYACWMFFQRAYSSIIRRSLNMFTLIGIGSGVAWIFSIVGILLPDVFPDQFKTEAGTVHVYFEAATVILTLVLLGQLLEARAHNKTNSAVKELLKLAPNEAVRVENGVEQIIPIEDIELGDLLRVKPGDKIPVDGKLTEGESTVDESMISGEPIPVDKIIGENVSAGTINGTQSFIMVAEKIGADTLLSQIIEMVNNASRSQAPIQKLADKISSYFVPIIIGVSIITFFIWVVFGPEPVYVYGFVNAIAVLIIACPCALGLATPMSVMVGVGKGAQLGILIKDAKALEKMNQVDTLIIDKTGTVTEGKPSVEKVVSFGKIDDNLLTKYVASVNLNSEHPLANATVKYAKENKLTLLESNNFNSITGKGVEANIGENKILIGNEKLLSQNKITIPETILAAAKVEQELGKTVPYIAVQEKVVGYVVISDAIKASSRKAISMLQKSGIDVIMMTGDNKFTAKAVASELLLSKFYADCLPEDKLKMVEQLQEEGKTVAMAGDGINDAPALALSNIGIAMGTGTDVAIESSDITLVKGDLNGILKTQQLSKKVMQNIKQNLFFALVYNAIGVPIAAGALFLPFHILLSPMLAALAMSFSSVSVITNALRLKSVRIK
jgi:Cu2+-exporting ATPase